MSKSLKVINKIPFAPVVAIAFGLVTAILVFAVPAWRFAQMIVATGLPNILSAARPPLGDTARALVAISLGLAVCASLWIGLSILRSWFKRAKPGHIKSRGTRIEPVIIGKAPVVPAASASKGHRRPIFAERDLGAPFMSDEVLSAQGIEPEREITPVMDVTEGDELILDPQWAASPPITPESSPVPTPRLDPVVPLVTTPPRPKPVANQSLSDLIVRLDAAMEARNQRESARPSGDIISLREALSGLSATHR